MLLKHLAVRLIITRIVIMTRIFVLTASTDYSRTGTRLTVS